MDRAGQPTAAEALDIEAVTYLMGSPQGRRVVWKVLSSAGTFRMTYARDPYETAFREGRRAVGLELVALVTSHAPDAYQTMVRENTESGV